MPSSTRTVAVIVGSLRKESFNRKMAKALIALAPPTLKLEIVEIGQLPLYNQDDDADPPPDVDAISEPHPAADARAVRHARVQPLGPRRAEERDRRRLAPLRQERLERQAGAVVSVSPGAIGGFGANHHLRQSLVFLERAGDAAAGSLHRRRRQAVRRSGKLNNESTEKFMKRLYRRLRRLGRAPRQGGDVICGRRTLASSSRLPGDRLGRRPERFAPVFPGAAFFDVAVAGLALLGAAFLVAAFLVGTFLVGTFLVAAFLVAAFLVAGFLIAA